MSNWAHFFVIFAVALVATASFVPLVRKFAVAHGVVDQPGPRRVNKKPIPRMGGVAMYLGLVVATVVECLGEAFGLWDGVILGGPPAAHVQVAGIVIGCTIIVAVGVADDVVSLRPGVKFLGQLLAALVIVMTGTLLTRFHLPLSPQVISLGGFVYPVTVLYLVAFINIINLIDGLDGLAAGITSISALTLFILMVTLHNGVAAIIALALVGACVGFLFYNFNPASIFMGDSGSMLLGLLLGTISLLGVVRFASVTMLLVPIVIAAVPIIDTAGAIIRRIRGHKHISEADAGHIHHRLLLRGYSQRTAVLLIYLWTAALCIGALLIWEIGGMTKWIVLVALIIISSVIVWKLGLFRPVRQRHNRTGYTYDNTGVDPDEDDDEDGKQ